MKITPYYLYLLTLLSPLISLGANGCVNPYCDNREESSEMFVEGYLQTLQDKGIGYYSGYSTAAFQLFPNFTSPAKSLYFIDARVHYFNDNRWAANLGFATRWYSRKQDKVLGLNVFYDFRQIYNEYHQIGAGLEILSRCYDIRINGYFPIAHTEFFGRKHEYNYPGGYFASCQGVQRALFGADAEFFTSLDRWGCYCSCPRNIDPYIGIGPYFYFQRHDKNQIWGGKARVGANFGDRFTLEARGSYDHFYGAIVQGFFSINFSMGAQPKPYTGSCECDPYFEATLYEPIQRQEIIVDNSKCERWESNF